MADGKWVPLGDYAAVTHLSKSAIYRRVRTGRLQRRVHEGLLEIYVEDADDFARLFRRPARERGEEHSDGAAAESPGRGAVLLQRVARDEQSGEIVEYVPADQRQIQFIGRSLGTLLYLYREVLAEKNRQLKSVRSTESDLEARVATLDKRVADLEAQLEKRGAELKTLERLLAEKDDFLNYQDRSLSDKDHSIAELRSTLEHRADELERRFRLMQELEEAVVDLRMLNTTLERRIAVQSMESADVAEEAAVPAVPGTPDMYGSAVELPIVSEAMEIEQTAPPMAALASVARDAMELPVAEEAMEIIPVADTANDWAQLDVSEADIPLADPKEFF